MLDTSATRHDQTKDAVLICSEGNPMPDADYVCGAGHHHRIIRTAVACDEADGEESALPTLLWCVKCNEEWEIDNQPTGCTCGSGGFYRISVDGGVWTDQVSATADVGDGRVGQFRATSAMNLSTEKPMTERYVRVDLAGALATGCRDCGAVVWDQEVHDTWHGSASSEDFDDGAVAQTGSLSDGAER